MEKRAHKRVAAIIAARFSGDSAYSSNTLGTIMNISENGMRIESCNCLQTNSKAELSIYANEQVLHVPCKVVRIIKDSTFYSAMGIKVLQLTPDYLEFVNTLKPSQ
jgi:hypothetical protein